MTEVLPFHRGYQQVDRALDALISWENFSGASAERAGEIYPEMVSRLAGYIGKREPMLGEPGFVPDAAWYVGRYLEDSVPPYGGKALRDVMEAGRGDPVAEFVGIVAEDFNGRAEGITDWLCSEEYALSTFGADAVGTGFCTGDLEENAGKFLRHHAGCQYGTGELEAAAMRGGLRAAAYDGGCMGYHRYDGDEDYLETGCVFLGNGEESYRLEDSEGPAMALDGISVFGESLSNACCYWPHDGYLYATSSMVVYWYVPAGELE